MKRQICSLTLCHEGDLHDFILRLEEAEVDMLDHALFAVVGNADLRPQTRLHAYNISSLNAYLPPLDFLDNALAGHIPPEKTPVHLHLRECARHWEDELEEGAPEQWAELCYVLEHHNEHDIIMSEITRLPQGNALELLQESFASIWEDSYDNWAVIPLAPEKAAPWPQCLVPLEKFLTQHAPGSVPEQLVKNWLRPTRDLEALEKTTPVANPTLRRM